jgi:hypothetical protein
MQKFTVWTSEHDTHVAKRHAAHKKARRDDRNQPVVRKVETATAPEAPAAPAEEAKTEE